MRAAADAQHRTLGYQICLLVYHELMFSHAKRAPMRKVKAIPESSYRSRHGNVRILSIRGGSPCLSTANNDGQAFRNVVVATLLVICP